MKRLFFVIVFVVVVVGLYAGNRTVDVLGAGGQVISTERAKLKGLFLAGDFDGDFSSETVYHFYDCTATADIGTATHLRSITIGANTDPIGMLYFAVGEGAGLYFSNGICVMADDGTTTANAIAEVGR